MHMSSTVANIELTSIATTTEFHNFNPINFVKLIEEYTHFTKQEPQNPSEELIINQLIQRLSAQNLNIEEEIQHNKTFYNGATPKPVAMRLRQYNDAAKTALKELYKRQNKVKILAQNLLHHEHPTTHVAFDDMLHEHKTTLSTRQRIKDCFLQFPILTSC